MFLAIAVLALQTSLKPPTQAKPLEPILAIGSSIEINRTVQEVAKLTEKGDFAGAKAAVRLLPSQSIKVEWDDAVVPKTSRFDFDRQRDMVFSEWQNALGLVSYSTVKTGADLKVTFDQSHGIKLVWSEDPQQPRLTATIGLTQGDGAVDPAAVHNDFSYALGTYYGITRLPLSGIVMSGNDSATVPLGVSPLEKGIAVPNLLASARIREQVMRSGVVASGSPAIQDDPQPQNLGTVLQGTAIEIKIPIKNSGSSPLVYQILPDCSCFSSDKPRSLKPSDEIQHIVRMSTTEYTGVVQGGVLHHNLFLISNDPSNPVRVIPVEVKVKPRYRFLPNSQVMIANDQGSVTVQAFLYFPPDHPLAITSAESQGLPGEVVFEPWQGLLADPDLGEGPLPRKGYKFTLKLKNIPEGGQMGTLIAVGTDDPAFDQIGYTVMVQRGILASPQSIFLGEIGGAPRSMYFMLSRPGKAFQVVSLQTDSPHLKAAYVPTQKAGEYRVTVTYDGKAVQGDFHATVIIRTDDKKQPEIDVPVLGTVR